MLRRDRTVNSIAIASLAIGIGLTTAMFAVLDAISHPVVPYRDPDRLFTVVLRAGEQERIPAGDLLADIIRREGHLFAGATTRAALLAPVMTIGDRPRAVSAVRIGANYFDMVGLSLMLGRGFDAQSSTEHVAVVAASAWRELGGNSARVGETRVVINDTAFTVIGVVPQAAADALGIEVWLPAPPIVVGNEQYASVVVRTRETADIREARREIEGFIRRLMSRDVGNTLPTVAVQLVSVVPDPIHAEDYHHAMVGAAACVLLIACANIATLLLSRSAHRRRDLAIHAALGATRSRIMRRLVADHATIALLGGALGIGLGALGIDVAMRAVPDSIRSALLAPRISWRVLGFGLATCIATLALFGVWPAVRAASVDPAEALKNGTAALTQRSGRSRELLVTIEFALAALLLVASGLLARTVYNTATFDFGFSMQGLVSTQVIPPNVGTRMAQLRAAQDRAAVSALRAEAGQLTRSAVRVLEQTAGIVAAASLAERAVPGRMVVPQGGAAASLQNFQLVSAGFARTFGLTIVRGSDFPSTPLSGEPMGIIDEHLERRLWRGGSAIGRTLTLGAQNNMTIRIVGVVKPIFLRLPSDLSVEAEPLLAVLADSTDRLPAAFVVARVGDRPPAAVARVTSTLRRQLSAAALTPVVRWSDAFRPILDRQQFLGALFVAFAIVGLTLALIGLYGAMSYMVERRSRELAVRVALGANRSDVLGLVYRHAAIVVLAGMGIGGFAAMWISQFIDSILFGVYRIDVLTVIVTDVVLALAAVAACWMPARRAVRADPVVVMRAT